MWGGNGCILRVGEKSFSIRWTKLDELELVGRVLTAKSTMERYHSLRFFPERSNLNNPQGPLAQTPPPPPIRHMFSTFSLYRDLYTLIRGSPPLPSDHGENPSGLKFRFGLRILGEYLRRACCSMNGRTGTWGGGINILVSSWR